jgi:hypothetical protein
MSPLARIRQVAACTALVCFSGSGMAAGPPAAAPAVQVAPGAGAAQATQGAAAVQSPQADQAPPSSHAAAAVQTTQSAGTTQGAGAAQPPQASQAPGAAQPPQPAEPVRLVPNAAAQIAHSALLSVDGTAAADALRLNIRRVSDKSPVSSDDVTVTVDGRNQSVTRENTGYEVPINDLRGGEPARDVEVIVAHDGIREILSGKVVLAEGTSTQSLFRDHKQVAWWILNIVIVLVAAIALSRRKG